MLCNKLFSFLHKVSSFFSLLFSWIVVVKLISRGHCAAPDRPFPPSAKEETCWAGSDKEEIKSQGLSLLFTAKGRSSAEKQPDFRNLSLLGLFTNNECVKVCISLKAILFCSCRVKKCDNMPSRSTSWSAAMFLSSHITSVVLF